MRIIFGKDVRNKARAILRAAPGYSAWRAEWGPGHDLPKDAIIAGAQALGVWPSIEELLAAQVLVRKRRTPVPDLLNGGTLSDITMGTDLAAWFGLDKTTVTTAMRKLGCEPLTVYSADHRKHNAWRRADVERLLACPRHPRGGFIIVNGIHGPAAPAPTPAANGRVVEGEAYPAMRRAMNEMATAMELLSEAFVTVARLVAALGSNGKDGGGDVAAT